MSTLRIIRVAFLSTLLLFSSSATMAQNPAFVREWEQFRASHPYHIQIVGLSEPDENRHRLLLISEPPPHVTSEGVTAVNPSVLGNLFVKSNQIGYNGWTKDILVDLPPMNDQDLRLLVDQLHRYLFGTSYKAYAVPLPYPEKTNDKGYQLDLHVPASSLSSWLLTQNTSIAGPKNPQVTFVPIEGGSERDLRVLLGTKISGVFISTQPGLVVWTFPRIGSLSKYALEARQFSLDSDIILGAIANADEIAIVARERVVPVWSLPPLRVETMMLLASVHTDELAQSYERTNLFAGRYDDEHHQDWAPIYLSPELIDTEYGSLLNITDQILKSWSEGGQIEYIAFKYPPPNSWPFPEPLSLYANTPEITFNWNTKGAGYTVADGGFEIYALNRTGALPVDYLSLNNAQLRKAEDDGYAYFASQNDPNLVRVVQYAGLYQLFRRFHVTPQVPRAPQPASPKVLRSSAAMVVSAIEKLSDDRAKKILTDTFDEAPQVLDEELKEFHNLRESISSYVAKWNATGISVLVDDIASPRDASSILSDRLREPSRQMALSARTLSHQIAEHQQVVQVLVGLDLGSIKNRYGVETDHPERGWIRTSTIVISHPTETLKNWSGGHNLDASVSLFRSSRDVPSGSIEVVGENGRKVTLYNPADSLKIDSLVRIMGRDEANKSTDELKKELQDALNRVPESEEIKFPDSLGFTAKARPAGPRGMDPDSIVGAIGSLGYHSGQGIDSDEQAVIGLLSAHEHSGIVVDRDQASGRYLIFHGSAKRAYEAADVASAEDAVLSCMRQAAKDGLPVRLHLRGLDLRQARGFKDAVELNLGDLRPSDIVASMDDSKLSGADLSRILEDDYDFKRATIEDVPMVVDPRDQHADVSLEFPAKDPAEPALGLHIGILKTTNERLLLIRNAAAKWAAQLSGVSDTATMESSVPKLIKELEKIDSGAQLRIWLSRESKDLYIVHNQPLRQSTRDAA